MKGIRWQQRFANYCKALEKLNVAFELINNNYQYEMFQNDFKNKEFNEILKEGLIQRFGYRHELTWNVMKDFFENNIFKKQPALRLFFDNYRQKVKCR